MRRRRRFQRGGQRLPRHPRDRAPTMLEACGRTWRRQHDRRMLECANSASPSDETGHVQPVDEGASPAFERGGRRL